MQSLITRSRHHPASFWFACQIQYPPLMTHHRIYLFKLTLPAPFPQRQFIQRISMRCQQFWCYRWIDQIADLWPRINLVQQFQSMKRKHPQSSVSTASSWNNGRICRVEPHCFNRSLMITPLSHRLHLLHRKQMQFVVIASSCHHITRWRYLQPTYFLIMCPISKYLISLSNISDAHVSISASRANYIVCTANWTDSPQMHCLISLFFLPLNVEKGHVTSRQSQNNPISTRLEINRT